MKIEKILVLSKGNVLDSWNNVLLSKEKCFQFRRTNFYVSDLFGITAKYNIFWSFPATVWECTERRTDHLELGSGGPRTRAEEGAVEGHGRARRRGMGARGGGRTRKKRAAVSRKANGRRREEEEGGGVRRGRRRADRSAPGAGGYIPERITPGASHQPGVKGLYSRCELPTEGTPGW